MDDAELLKNFEVLNLSRAQWTHRAHVRVGYIYLTMHSFDDALRIVRRRIQALNASNGVDETPPNGYNETITRAFLQLIAAAKAEHGNSKATSDEFCAAHPHLMTSKVLDGHYSKELLKDPRTKLEFIAPDLAPLPTP